jgi:hypothetical protein
MAMKEAVSRFVHSGDTIFVSGCQHGEPTAAVSPDPCLCPYWVNLIYDR